MATEQDTPAAPAARRRKGAPETAVLNPEMIVGATLVLINEAGLDAFTLRALAKRLGVFPTAIYWHVPGRTELLSRAVALALQDVLPRRKGRSWQDYLTAILARFRNAIRRNPNIAPLVGAQLISNTNISFEFLEAILATIEEAGASGPNLVAAYNLVIASIVGFTIQEFAPLPSEETTAWQDQVRERLATIDQRRYPVLAQNIQILANQAFVLRAESGTEAPLDDSFRGFVTGVIGGVERLASLSQQGETAAHRI